MLETKPPGIRSKSQAEVDSDNIHSLVLKHREQLQQSAADPGQAVPIDKGSGLSDVVINLADTGIATTTPKAFDTPGYGLVYRREGSAPQGRLNIDIGGRVFDFYPGATLRGNFTRFTATRAARSASLGNARLVVLQRADSLFIEPAELPGERFSPVDLLGNSVAGTFVDMLVDTQPTGAAPAYSFDVTGYDTIRLLIDGLQDGTNTLASTVVIPWAQEPNSALWFEQGTMSQPVPDSGAGSGGGTGYRYRVVTFSVAGRCKMAFELRSTTGTPGTPTKLGFIVQGLRG